MTKKSRRPSGAGVPYDWDDRGSAGEGREDENGSCGISLFVRIYSRYHVVFEGEADFASIPTRMGEVGILENHIRMYSKLENGIIRLRNGSNEQEFTCTGGIMEVLPKEIRILVDSAENVEMIDEARAAEAVHRGVVFVP